MSSKISIDGMERKRYSSSSRRRYGGLAGGVLGVLLKGVVVVFARRRRPSRRRRKADHPKSQRRRRRPFGKDVFVVRIPLDVKDDFLSLSNRSIKRTRRVQKGTRGPWREMRNCGLMNP